MFGGIKGSYSPDKDIPDLSGKVIIVTGANSGIGLETLHQLVKHNPLRIYLGARDAAKAAKAIESLKEKVPEEALAKISHLELDLASLESVNRAAAAFLEKELRLDLLINNAGIMVPPPAVTEEGYEIQFGTNHVGHAVLTRKLLPVLLKTAAEPNADVRIISLTSEGENFAPKGGILFDSLKSPQKDLSGFQRYGQSKLANAMYAKSLAQYYPSILSVAVHPGGVQSNLSQGAKTSYPMLSRAIDFIHNSVTVPVAKGAWNSLWASTAPRSLLKNGAMYYPVMREVGGSKNYASKDLVDRLWAWTEGEFASHGVAKAEEIEREQPAPEAPTAPAAAA